MMRLHVVPWRLCCVLITKQKKLQYQKNKKKTVAAMIDVCALC